MYAGVYSLCAKEFLLTADVTKRSLESFPRLLKGLPGFCLAFCGEISLSFWIPSTQQGLCEDWEAFILTGEFYFFLILCFGAD